MTTKQALRNSISETLVKWHMPTRQAAINEILEAIDAYTKQQVREAEDRMTDDITQLCKCGHSQHTQVIYVDCKKCSCKSFKPALQGDNHE